MLQAVGGIVSIPKASTLRTVGTCVGYQSAAATSLLAHAFHVLAELGLSLAKERMDEAAGIGTIENTGKAVHAQLSLERTQFGMTKVLGNDLFLKDVGLMDEDSRTFQIKRHDVVLFGFFGFGQETVQLGREGFVMVGTSLAFPVGRVGLFRQGGHQVTGRLCIHHVARGKRDGLWLLLLLLPRRWRGGGTSGGGRCRRRP